MRFLFGLIIGAVITLLVATAMNAPTGRIVHQLVKFWQQSVAKVSQAQAITAHSPASTQPQALAAESPASITPQQPPTPSEAPLQSAAAEDTTVAALPETAVVPPAVQAPAPDETTFAAEPPAAEMAASDVSLFAVEQSQGASTMAQDAVPGQAVVWAPFHSEASAKGFASRLSQQLARPFHVKKQGAANYLVVYDYADEADRSALEQQIAYATGQDAP